MVDKAVANIQKLMDSKQLQEGQYIFLKYLLGRKELSYKDISMMALSMFYDGIQTVSSSEHLLIYIKYRIFYWNGQQTDRQRDRQRDRQSYFIRPVK